MSGLTYDAAVAMLPDGDEIHTIMGSLRFLVGADWSREAVLSAMRESPELCTAEPIMAEMGHGLAVYHGDHWVFVQTADQSPTPDQASEGAQG